MHQKLLYFLITLFTTATLVSGYSVIRDQKSPVEKNTVSTQLNTDTPAHTQNIESDIKNSIHYTETTQKKEPESDIENSEIINTSTTPDTETHPYEIFEAKVTLAIDGKNLHIPYHDSMTAERAMRDVAQRYPESFHYEGIEYGGDLGTFVTAINGKKENPQEKMRWILYLNGSPSPKGISILTLNPDDILSWNYEKETL